MSSSDSISLSTSSSSESTKSERSRGRQFDEEGTSSGGMISGIPMETVREVREDPPEELAESNWPAKGGYGWTATDVCNQSFVLVVSSTELLVKLHTCHLQGRQWGHRFPGES